MKLLEKKSYNVIISGVTESTGKNKEEIANSDMKKAVEIINIIQKEANGHDLCAGIKAHGIRRLRKNATDDKPAHLIVEFPHPDYAKIALAHCKILKETSGYGSVYVNPDLTESEQKIAYELRKERKERKK